MDVISFALLGLGTGAIYALVAQGIVVVFRGSGVLNFAQGAFVMVGAYAYYELTANVGLPAWLAIVGAVILGVALGAVVHLVLLRRMRQSSPLARVVVTLGVLIVIQSLAVLIYGPNTRAVEPLLPQRQVKMVADVTIGLDRIILLVIAFAVSFALMVIYSRTTFGRVTAAVAENQVAAATLGHSPDRVAAANWAIGSGLAAFAGCLVAPITYLDTNQLVLLVVPAMAAGLIGAFRSFPLSLAGSLAIGVIESDVQRYVSAPGWVSAVPFLVVVGALMVRGQSLPSRGFITDRLPAVSASRLRPVPTLLVFVGGSIALLYLVDAQWAAALTVGIAITIMCLSVVVITGFAGQLSLAQYVLAGLGAFSAAKLMSSQGLPFLAGLGAAVLVAVILGALLGLPSLRVRGQNLAIASLGLAVVAYSLVLTNPTYAGSVEGISVPPLSIFGWSIDAYSYPGRYAFVAFVFLMLVVLVISNVRRGRIGRRLLAVRSNERAAASVGVSVPGAKIFAFAVGGAIAAVGGTFFANLQFSTIASQFSVLPSVNLVTVTVVGGVGSIGGAFLGALLVPGGPLTLLLRPLADIDKWLPLLGGVYVLHVLVTSPDGVFIPTSRQLRRISAWLTRPLRRGTRVNEMTRTKAAARVLQAIAAAESDPDAGARIEARALEVSSLTVRFGGVVAVDGVSLTVEPGTVHGLIGPNGAGKTTFIDAVTGYVTPTTGKVSIDGLDVTGSSPRRTARRGLVRSFQSVELFDDLSVLENLAVACDDGSAIAYLRDLILPERISLSREALEAISQFDLAEDLDKLPAELSFGRRRLLAIARAVAATPSVLMLDEPAAGLDDAETAELAALVRSLADTWGIGVLLVEHDIDMVMKTCDVVTVLAQGAVLASGSPAEIKDDAAVLEAYLGTRADAPEPHAADDLPSDRQEVAL